MTTEQMQDRLDHLKSERDQTGEHALRVIARLREDLDRMEEAITGAMKDAPVYRNFTPGSQNLAEVTEYGAKFEQAWNTYGLLNR